MANPNDRDTLLADLRRALDYMKRLDCPAIIMLSGNVVGGMSRQKQHRRIEESSGVGGRQEDQRRAPQVQMVYDFSMSKSPKAT